MMTLLVQYTLRGVVLAILTLVLINMLVIVKRNVYMHRHMPELENMVEPKWVIFLATGIFLILGALAWALVEAINYPPTIFAATVRYACYAVGSFMLLIVMLVGGRAQKARINAYRIFKQQQEAQ